LTERSVQGARRESDELRGGFLSHFELYLQGMDEARAETSAISRFLERLRAGQPVRAALAEAPAPARPRYVHRHLGS
jgi:DUF3050 family protein